MTARSVSWTDAAEVRSLLARASAEKPQGRGGLVRAMGRADAARPMPPPRVIDAAAPRVTVESPPRPAEPTPEPAKSVRKVAPKLRHTAENPSDRLDALIAWTLDHFPCAGAFVADDNGLTLVAHGISEAQVSIMGPLLAALVGIRIVPGVDATAGTLWLGAQMLSWVESRTERGGFCLGTVGAEGLSAREFEQLREALATTVYGL